MGEHIESLLEKAGGWGRYQKIVVTLMCTFYIPMGFFVFAPVFTYHTPPHRCYIPDIDGIDGNGTTANRTTLETYIPSIQSVDGSFELASCARFTTFEKHTAWNDTSRNGTTAKDRETEGCLDGWIYIDPEGITTASTEFNLVCDDAWKKPVLTSGLIAGLFLGSIISGPLNDRFGRRLMSLINMVLHAVLIIAFSFTPSYEMLLAMVITIGTSHIIWYGGTFVLAQELVDKNHRAMVCCIINVLYSIGYIVLPGVAYLLKDWRWILKALGLASLVFLPFIFFLPESPRWLASKGRNLEAYNILKRIARWNRKDQSFLDDLKMNNMELAGRLIENTEAPGRKRRKSSVQILATNSVMRTRSFLICWVWNVSFLCYYALGYNTSNLGGNNYLNCFVAAALDIPCHFFVTFSIQRFGRRSSTSAFIGLAGLFLAITPAFAAFNAVTITLAMLGKFFAAATVGILYLYTTELYPTLLRNTGLGMASMSSRFGSICAPFLIFVGENGNKYVPIYVMAALGLLTAVLSLFLPETKHAALPDTMMDAVNLRKFRAFSFSFKRFKRRNESQAPLTAMPTVSKIDNVVSTDAQDDENEPSFFREDDVILAMDSLQSIHSTRT